MNSVRWKMFIPDKLRGPASKVLHSNDYRMLFDCSAMYAHKRDQPSLIWILNHCSLYDAVRHRKTYTGKIIWSLHKQCPLNERNDHLQPNYHSSRLIQCHRTGFYVAKHRQPFLLELHRRLETLPSSPHWRCWVRCKCNDLGCNILAEFSEVCQWYANPTYHSVVESIVLELAFGRQYYCPWPRLISLILLEDHDGVVQAIRGLDIQLCIRCKETKLYSRLNYTVGC